jgi:RNA polymerase sigma-70 factor, ECF subfamily
MTCPPTLSLITLCTQAHAEAYAYHGDLHLDAATFSLRLQQIINQQLPPEASPAAACILLEKLHKIDFYLTCACTNSTEDAWRRFLHLYRRYIYNLACHTCGSLTLGDEVAGHVLTDLCLPDRQGRSRIGSYGGRGPLAAWLRAIVVHQAYKECNRPFHHAEPLVEMAELPDQHTAGRMAASLREQTYREAICAALQEAIGQLSERERLILLMRYEEGLQGEEVARALRLNPSTISRGLQAAQRKLKETIVNFLTARWAGRSADINDCLIDIQENPSYSLLTLIRESTPQWQSPSA